MIRHPIKQIYFSTNLFCELQGSMTILMPFLNFIFFFDNLMVPTFNLKINIYCCVQTADDTKYLKKSK